MCRNENMDLLKSVKRCVKRWLRDFFISGVSLLNKVYMGLNFVCYDI